MRSEKFVNIELFSHIKHLKQKYPPISEKIGDVEKILQIRNIYQLTNKQGKYYLIVVRDKAQGINKRAFICCALATQSSDFLVKIAKNVIKKHNHKLKLLQYSLYPNSLRINLICMADLNQISESKKLLALLDEIKLIFRAKLDQLADFDR